MAQQNAVIDSSGLFKLDLLVNLDLKTYSYYEVGLKKLIAIASLKELIFLFISPQGEKKEKKFESNLLVNNINCMCFENTGTWVLVVTDQRLLLVPFLPAFTPHQAFDYKWSLTDFTVIQFPTLPSVSKFTAVVWWLTREADNIAIIGSQTGSIIFFSLDSNSILGETKIPDEIVDLQISFDDSLDLLVLVITSTSSQQWKLILEHRSVGYIWLQQHRSLQDKEKKEGFMSYIKQLSKDKITIFSQGSSKDDSKSPMEYTAKPVEYLPQFRKGSNNWALTVQYVNGRHFLTAFEMNEGTMILESTEAETPTRSFLPEIKKNGRYLQGLWSQRLIYLLRKNELEIHSSSLALTQDATMDNGTRRSTSLWNVELNGDFLKSFVLTARDPDTLTGWCEPTFMCDLRIPRFTMQPCLVITTKGVYVATTMHDPTEWLVGQIMRGASGTEDWASALGAPMPPLLRGAADMLLSRGKVAPAQYLYSLAQSQPDGWIARLGVYGRLKELIAFKPTGNNISIGTAAITIKVLAQLLKIVIDNESMDLYVKYRNLSRLELKELCAFASATGLWNLLPKLSIYQGFADLFMSAIAHKPTYCRGAINCLIRQKHAVLTLLEDDGLTMLNYIRENYNLFDIRLLKKMALWLCPLQDQFRPILRDRKQGIMNRYGASMTPLIHAFMHLVCAIEAREPCPEIHSKIMLESETWKYQFVPKRALSCGLAHWALVDNGSAKIMLADTNVNTELVGRVESVACGRHHTLLLTENGIYAAGDNTYGQLGVGTAWGGEPSDGASGVGSLLFVARGWGAPFVAVAAGYYHSAAIDVGGRLYTWGWGVHGQLGLGSIEDEWSPQLVTKLQGRKVLSVGCGSCHTAVLMKNGEVWAFGAGVFGQLGTGSRDKSSIPIRVAFADPVEAIAVGYFHNVALTAKGQVYVWGASPQAVRAAHTRRSMSPSEPTSPALSDPQPDPHLLPALVDLRNVRGDVVQMAAGWHHSALIDSTGTIYTWGLNFDGQLGSGDRKQIPLPTEVQINTESPTDSVNNENLTSIKPFIALKTNTTQTQEVASGGVNTKALVACGGDFTVYLDDDGRIFVTGYTHQQTNNGGKPSNRVIMMKTTKRVIKIPTNRSNNKYLFQPVDRLDMVFDSEYPSRKRVDMEPYCNPLGSLADFKEKSWIDTIILSLKPYIKEEYVAPNLNIAAKLAYHNNLYTDCLRYLLDDLDKEDITEQLFLKHTEWGSDVATPSPEKQEQRSNISNETLKRIKDISMMVLHEKPYSTESANLLTVLPCCCDELKHLPKGIPISRAYSRRDPTPISARAANVVDKCLSMFPVNSNLWETCFNVTKEYYLKRNLSVVELEPVLKKYMDKDVTAMAIAIMFSNDCVQYSELFSSSFYLRMCSKIMDTWG